MSMNFILIVSWTLASCLIRGLQLAHEQLRALLSKIIFMFMAVMTLPIKKNMFMVVVNLHSSVKLIYLTHVQSVQHILGLRFYYYFFFLST